MIDRIWFGHSRLYLLLLPFSWLYGLITWLIRLSYRSGLRVAWRSPIPIVVVGNLTVGGNGKTPIVIWLVEQLKKRGLQVGVVSRGYSGKSGKYPLILSHHTEPEEAGDEPVVIFQRTGVPVAVAPKRKEAIRALLKKHPLDLLIADDGLQHYALKRDFELVVIDGIRRFGNACLLPAGPMRENITRLHSVDAIIINGGEAQKEEILMQLRPSQAVNLVTGEKKPVEELISVIAMAGIGHPDRFFMMLAQLGVNIIKTQIFSDHQHYTLSTLLPLAKKTQSLCMTEKDAVKCKAFAQPNWWYLPVSADFPFVQSQKLLASIEALCHRIC